ncbi:MAG: cold shock domain-containing protein [Gammaproteobacteria bacterium]|nr:cold shock domain-containing protein [Gammaproteobacteria bacterium]
MDGTVKWFSKEKGFGFIVGSDDIERFFGVRDIKGVDLPNNGDLVEFDSVDGKKGPKAINITITSKGESLSDERVSCSNCGKKMIPRIITGPPLVHGQGSWTPVPKKSICPFCGSMHQKFSASAGEKIGLVIFVIVFICIVGFISSIF